MYTRTPGCPRSIREMAGWVDGTNSEGLVFLSRWTFLNSCWRPVRLLSICQVKNPASVTIDLNRGILDTAHIVHHDAASNFRLLVLPTLIDGHILTQP